EALPILIQRLHVHGQEDPTPGLAQAIVQFVVLIAHQFLVEQSDLFEDAARIHAHVHRVDLTVLGGNVEVCADAEARRHRQGNGVPDAPASECVHWAADVVGAGLAQRLDANADVRRGQVRVRVHPCNDLAARRPDADVHRRGYDAPRVTQYADAIAIPPEHG